MPEVKREVCISRFVAYTLQAEDGSIRTLSENELIQLMKSGNTNISNLALSNGVIVKSDSRHVPDTGVTRQLIRGKVAQSLLQNKPALSELLESNKILELNTEDMGNLLRNYNWGVKWRKVAISGNLACYLLSDLSEIRHVLLIPSDIKSLTVRIRRGELDQSQDSNVYEFSISDQIGKINGELAVVGGVGLEDLGGAFRNVNNIKKLNLSRLCTRNVRYMDMMLGYCRNLTELSLDNVCTENVISMACMFRGCESLISLDLNNFNTGNVISMQGMFQNCIKLGSLQVNNFNTSNVINMQDMFYNCELLTSLDLSHFDTSNVTNMSGMFSYCSSLQFLDVSHFNTSKVTDMSWMFYCCSSLTSLDLSNFNTSKVKNMQDMFSCCNSLQSLDVSNFNTSKVEDMQRMFRSCESLEKLDLSNFNTSNTYDMASMFYGCKNLIILNIWNMTICDIREVVVACMFGKCESLQTIIANKITKKHILKSVGGREAFKDCKANIVNNIS